MTASARYRGFKRAASYRVANSIKFSPERPNHSTHRLRLIISARPTPFLNFALKPLDYQLKISPWPTKSPLHLKLDIIEVILPPSG